jgi:hypothetical protein
VPKQNLDSAEISSRLVDNRRLGSAQRVGAIIFAGKSDSRDPFVNKASVLPGAYVGCVIGTDDHGADPPQNLGPLSRRTLVEIVREVPSQTPLLVLLDKEGCARAQFRPCLWLFVHEWRTEGEQRVPFVRYHDYKAPRRNPETRAKPAFSDNDSDMEMRQ